MPPLNLAKKLKPARKAWRSFTIKVKSKLETLDFLNSIESTTRRLLEFCSFHLFAPFKRRFLSGRRRRFNYDCLCTYQNQPRNRKVIYIDQLYGEPMSMQLQAKHKEPPQEAETSRRSVEEVEESSGGVYSIEDAWKAVVAKSPHLRGVDERADEFIYKFREERKLEKEQSDLDFQEMLARSA
ncbi:Glutathione S-transferase tau 7 [Hibiscus syriacus]|uniref:Glutathione S-transferase tau 7 n=1 Tax=Hibiscus syriacus TaxID=106335 RepID=A0A6A3CPV7_HIBSY|nr:uncharacterized protein LOC120151343 [Hibiscus syriacus]KAE8731545.1 Glutathione S-transferase tau 7 [Hibiscus syriacus]